VTSPPDKDDERRGRVARILALGLIWGVGILAILVQRAAITRPVTARPTAVAPAAAAVAADVTCLTTAATGRLTVRVGKLGCFESEEATFRMAWTDGHATISLDAWPERSLAPAERANVLRAIADAVQRSDDGRHGCTSSLDTRLEWICGTAPPGHVSFRESNCGRADGGPAHRVARAIQSAFGR